MTLKALSSIYSVLSFVGLESSPNFDNDNFYLQWYYKNAVRRLANLHVIKSAM